MTDFTELWPGGPRYAPPRHFPLGTDSILLADFVPLAGARRGVDLGCGGGILALLLLTRAERLHMTGLEILPEAAATAEENLRENGLADRGEIVCGDIRAVRERFAAGSFDLVAANPPFFPLGSGALPRDAERAAARGVAMSAQGLEPKRLRFVCAREGAAPSLALIEGRRGGAPGLAVEASLLLEDASGGESAELRRIYHR